MPELTFGQIQVGPFDRVEDGRQAALLRLRLGGFQNLGNVGRPDPWVLLLADTDSKVPCFDANDIWIAVSPAVQNPYTAHAELRSHCSQLVQVLIRRQIVLS